MATCAIDMYLKRLCEQNPDGFEATLIFKTAALTGGPAMGALRRVKDAPIGDDGALYELLSPGEIGDPNAPGRKRFVLAKNIFSVSAVERVILMENMPAPSVLGHGTNGSGLIIPT